MDEFMKVYFDVCCLCRPFDDQESHRIRIETEAIIAIISQCMVNWVFVSSEVVEYEIAQMIDAERKKSVENILQYSSERIPINTDIIARARFIHNLGIDTFDALHIASAESCNAIFLTTDDMLVRGIKKHKDILSTIVNNPVQWLMEVESNGNKNTQ
nr:PIN domain-containing protein [Methanocalculus sp. AMF5]